LIVSSGGLNDSLIHLNKFFRVTGAIIPIDVASLEFVWPSYLSEWSRQSTESIFSHRSNVLHQRLSWWGWCSKLEMPPTFSNVAMVILFTAVFPRGAILSDTPSYVMLGQMTIWTHRRRSFTSDTPCPIIVIDGRFPPWNANRLLCNDKVCHLSSLLSQDSKGGAIRHHTLDGLHNRLDLNNIEVWIQVPDQAAARCQMLLISLCWDICWSCCATDHHSRPPRR
jgi:hypothetical protein